MKAFRGEVTLNKELSPRDKWLEGRQVPKKQCSVCFHWVSTGFFKKDEDVCEACRDDDDGTDDLRAQWRIDRGV